MFNIMFNIMANEVDDNIYDLNSQEWMKILEYLNEEDSLSIDEILTEVNDELSKLLPTQVFYIYHFSLIVY